MDPSGGFTLSGVAPGSVTLELRGDRIRATASVAAQGGETARVTITLSPGRSTVVLVPRSDIVAIEGTVAGINPGTASFTVATFLGPVQIQTDAATVFRKGDSPATFADLQVGEEVYLYGTREKDGPVLAARVYIDVMRPTPAATPTRSETTYTPTRTERTTTPGSTRTPDLQAVLFGTVVSIDAGKASFVLKTDGGLFTIQTNSGTEFRKGDAPATFADIEVGSRAYALGTRQNDGSVLASKVFLLVSTPTPTVTPTRSEKTGTPTATRTRTEEKTPTPTVTPTRSERTATPTGTRTPG